MAQLIRDRFGLRYHVDHIGRLLHALGWSPQKPQRRAVERDEDEIRCWVKEEMAPGKKNCARLKAALVFIDESGFLMAPYVRRSWAPKGATPVLYQCGRSHQKVSAIAALCVPAERNAVRCYFRLHPAANIETSRVLSFLRQLSRQLKGKPFFVIWDRWQPHKAKAVRAFLFHLPAVGFVFLPSYAPELNPVEYVWNHLKTNPMANDPHREVGTLSATTRRHARSLQ